MPARVGTQNTDLKSIRNALEEERGNELYLRMLFFADSARPLRTLRWKYLKRRGRCEFRKDRRGRKLLTFLGVNSHG